MCVAVQQPNSIIYDVRSVPSLVESQSCVFGARHVCVCVRTVYCFVEGGIHASIWSRRVCASVSVHTLSADRVSVFKQIANETILHWFACIRNRNIKKSFFSQNVNRIFDSRKENLL